MQYNIIILAKYFVYKESSEKKCPITYWAVLHKNVKIFKFIIWQVSFILNANFLNLFMTPNQIDLKNYTLLKNK